jgi:hypothetical protein
VSPRKQRMSPEDAQKTASHAHQNLPCDDCGAAPGEPCKQSGGGSTVCKSRFVAAAIAIRRQAKAERRTPEQAAELAAILAGLPRLSREEVEAGRSAAGGFTRAQLASWGVPWPPPAGWLQALLRGEDGADDHSTAEKACSMTIETETALRNYDWLVRDRGPGDVALEWDTGTLACGAGGASIEELTRPGFTPATDGPGRRRERHRRFAHSRSPRPPARASTGTGRAGRPHGGTRVPPVSTRAGATAPYWTRLRGGRGGGAVTAQVLERRTFSVSRAADFLEVRALVSQTGQPEHRFGDVVVKELLDNALDACKTAGVQPKITVTVEADGDTQRVTVADNGSGIPPEVAARILDYSTLTSDKALYRSPCRGAQANALKTIIGIRYALGVAEPVVIEARRIRHVIAVGLDAVGKADVVHVTEDSARTEGTSVSVPLPASMAPDATGWVRGYALVNPHASFTVAEHGHDDDGEDPAIYKATAAGGWRKPVPADPTSAWWYDDQAFAKLAASLAAH